MARTPARARGKPDVLTIWGDCAAVARRPTGGFWAKVRLRMEVELPGGQRYIGGAEHIYGRVYPAAKPSPGRAPQGKGGRAAPAAGAAGKRKRAPRGWSVHP